jgi:hypothetical protein
MAGEIINARQKKDGNQQTHRQCARKELAGWGLEQTENLQFD